MYQSLLRQKGTPMATPAAMFDHLDLQQPGNSDTAPAPALGTGNAAEAVRQGLAPVLPEGSYQNPPQPPPYPAPPASESARRPFYYPTPESPVRR